MKNILILILALLGLPVLAQTIQLVDVTTPTTNSLYDTAQITVTNQFTNAWYYKFKTNNVQVGDSFYNAFIKLNGNTLVFSNYMATNTPGGGSIGADTNLSNISLTATNVIKSLAGGSATNAIGQLNGRGTNASLFGVTYLNNSNMTVFSVSSGAQIPTMTASNAPSGFAFANSEPAGHEAWKAFVGGGQNWNPGGSITNWLEYKFPSQVTVVSNYFSANTAGSGSVNLYASNDGTNWSEIYTASTASSPVLQSFNPVTASYFMWSFTNGGLTVIGSDQLFSTGWNVVSNAAPVEIYDAAGVGINTNNPSIYNLSVSGQVNTSDMYFVNGQPVFNILNVSGGTGLATNYNGTYSLMPGGNVFTNTATPSGLLLRGSYSFNNNMGTVFVSASAYQFVTNVPSLTAATFTNLPIYTSSSLLGQYSPYLASPSPGVTVSVPVMIGQSGAFPIQTNLVGPHGLTLLFTNGLFYGTTNY